MARLPRLDIPGVAQHIVKRGNDRQPCFAEDGDYLRYRQELGDAALKHGCALHAYVLMTNHVHLLVTPAEPGATSRMMQAIGRRYVACFNARYRRTGTLWEGRFKSSLVGGDDYVLTCYRYIELNPLRAGMVAHPDTHRWSSHAYNASSQHEARITPHPAYLALGTNAISRATAYRELVACALSADVVEAVRLHVQQQRVFGNRRFQTQIEALAQRAVGLQPRGRPKSITHVTVRDK